MLRRLRSPILVLVGLLLCSPLAAAAVDDRTVSALARRLVSAGMARYMEVKPSKGREGCAEVTDPAKKPEGWANFRIERCTYLGKVPAKQSAPLLVVLMANAGPERIARWLLTACADAGAERNPARARCLSRLYAHIKEQSGFQFPVAGLVDETKIENGEVVRDVCAGICYFTFRDGIAVRIRGFGDRKPRQGDGPLKPGEKDCALIPGTEVCDVERAVKAFDIASEDRGERQALYAPAADPGDFARISSTTRGHLDAYYKGKTPPYNHQGEEFRIAVRRHYQDALSADRNALISAYAKANAATLIEKAEDEDEAQEEAEWRLGN